MADEDQEEKQSSRGDGDWETQQQLEHSGADDHSHVAQPRPLRIGHRCGSKAEALGDDLCIETGQRYLLVHTLVHTSEQAQLAYAPGQAQVAH